MANGLSIKQQTKLFENLNWIYGLNAPTSENLRVDYLTHALTLLDRSEVEHYSVLCMDILDTFLIGNNNYSSELERSCTEYIVEAYRNGKINSEDMPLSGIDKYLSMLINFYIEYPDKSSEEIEELFEYARIFIDAREWNQLRAVYAESKGDFAEAKNYLDRFHALPRTEDSDCEGCEIDRIIKGALKRSDMKSATHYANVTFDRKLKCESSIPEKAHVQLALAAQFVDTYAEQPKQLEKLLTKASSVLVANKYHFLEAAALINAALNLNNLEMAANVLEMFRPVVNEFPYEMGNFQFYMSAYFVACKKGDIKDADNWLDRACKYATEFDTRNRNQYYKTCMDKALADGGFWVNTPGVVKHK